MTTAHRIAREAMLASPSPIINRLMEMLFDPITSLNDLATTLATDAALSARTLAAANAAFSYPKNRIDNVHDAVIRIGLMPVIHIVTATEIKAVFFSVPGKYGDMKQLWRHNLVTACIADAYALHLELEKPASWFTGGLLHDIGRLQLLVHDPIKYADVVTAIEQERIPVCEAEERAFGVSHQEIGNQLMRLWRFPEAIADAAFHHLPFVSHEHFRSGIGIANELANALADSEPLPQFARFSTERVVAEASVKYEVMKKVSGIT